MIVRVAFYKGRQRLFNRLTAWWTRGEYSHVELLLEAVGAGWLCWSSSLGDGGVRAKEMALKPEHWDVLELDLPPQAIAQARQWFEQHAGQGYDVLGLLGFFWRPWGGAKQRWFCSEAVAAALDLHEPWRFCPNALYAVLISGPPSQWCENKPASAGFLLPGEKR